MTSRLPPGQIKTERFPVVGERRPSAVLDPSTWSLAVRGLVDPEFDIGLSEFLDLAQVDLTFDIHCVTSWTRFDSVFSGIPLRELVTPLDGARYVSFSAYSDRDHHTSLPIDVAMSSSWLVHSFNHQPLTSEHGAPVRVVTPGKYFYKSIKWLKEIEFLESDRLGWWETNSAYHNNADPTHGDERFTTGSLRPDQVTRFLQAPNYDKYRGRVLLGLDLSTWRPASEDLRRLYLKNCNLDGVVLADTDLRNANLSLSSFCDADLSGADLSGADLEGADFTGADLTGADLSDTALSATRFQGSIVEGATFKGSWGLVESESAYLRSRGLVL